MIAAGFGVSSDRGRLLLGGFDVPQLVARAGRSPCFVYLRAAVTDQVRRLRRALPVGARLYYSPKANPMPALLQHLAPLVDGFDVASHGELRRALDAGMDPGRCLFTGPGKTLEEIHAAVASGVVVNIESATQLEQVVATARTAGVRAAVALRLNASFVPPRAHMRDPAGNQFGVDAAEAPALLARMNVPELAFKGFHVFWGSQQQDARAAVALQRQAYELALSVAEHAPGPVDFVNVGGGFAMPFFADDEPFDLETAGAAIRTWAPDATTARPGALTFEFGRYLVGGAGYYVCRVLDRKVIGGETFLVVDGGLHQHLLASGAFGQGRRRSFRIWPARLAETAPSQTVNVVGRLCSSLDRIASGVRLPSTAPGDYLVLPNSGAYGPTFSARDFLGHPAAVEMLV
jgi:diaminopimelate decarboxylase